MGRGLNPNHFREMTNPYAERKTIENEEKEIDPEKIRKIVDKITKDHELYEVADALLTKHGQSMLVPDSELIITSKETDYSIAVIGSLINKIEKDKKEKRQKMN